MKTPIYNTNRTPMPSSGTPSLNAHLEFSLNKTKLDITSRVMLRYIDRHGPQGFDALLTQFGDSGLPDSRHKMSSRLDYLVDAGHLQRAGVNVRNYGLGVVTYSLGVRHGGMRPPQADAATPVTPPPSRPATPLPPHDPSVRLPRAARPGADDYLHIPSLRGGQRVNSPTQSQSTANDAGWKKALADAIERDQRGKAGVAAVLGVSRGYVSQIVNGHRDVVPDAFVVRVLERLCAIQCPHLGQSIAHSVCRQHAGRKWEAISQFEVDHWRACQSCTSKAPDPLPTPLKPRPDEWVFVPRPSRHVTQGAPL